MFYTLWMFTRVTTSFWCRVFSNWPLYYSLFTIIEILIKTALTRLDCSCACNNCISSRENLSAWFITICLYALQVYLQYLRQWLQVTPVIFPSSNCLVQCLHTILFYIFGRFGVGGGGSWVVAFAAAHASSYAFSSHLKYLWLLWKGGGLVHWLDLHL